jgi:hypothetical protein
LLGSRPFGFEETTIEGRVKGLPPRADLSQILAVASTVASGDETQDFASGTSGD